MECVETPTTPSKRYMCGNCRSLVCVLSYLTSYLYSDGPYRRCNFRTDALFLCSHRDRCMFRGRRLKHQRQLLILITIGSHNPRGKHDDDDCLCFLFVWFHSPLARCVRLCSAVTLPAVSLTLRDLEESASKLATRLGRSSGTVSRASGRFLFTRAPGRRETTCDVFY